jgi:hypothetical protein
MTEITVETVLEITAAEKKACDELVEKELDYLRAKKGNEKFLEAHYCMRVAQDAFASITPSIQRRNEIRKMLLQDMYTKNEQRKMKSMEFLKKVGDLTKALEYDVSPESIKQATIDYNEKKAQTIKSAMLAIADHGGYIANTQMFDNEIMEIPFDESLGKIAGIELLEGKRVIMIMYTPTTDNGVTLSEKMTVKTNYYNVVVIATDVDQRSKDVEIVREAFKAHGPMFDNCDSCALLLCPEDEFKRAAVPLTKEEEEDISISHTRGTRFDTWVKLSHTTVVKSLGDNVVVDVCLGLLADA